MLHNKKINSTNGFTNKKQTQSRLIRIKPTVNDATTRRGENLEAPRYRWSFNEGIGADGGRGSDFKITMADTRRQHLPIRSSPLLQPPAGIAPAVASAFAASSNLCLCRRHKPSEALERVRECVRATRARARISTGTHGCVYMRGTNTARVSKESAGTQPLPIAPFVECTRGEEGRSTTPSSNILNFFRPPSAHGCALTTLSEFATKRATTRRPAMLLYRYDTFFPFFSNALCRMARRSYPSLRVIPRSIGERFVLEIVSV